MRLFLGIDLPEHIKTRISQFVAPIKKSEKGWESPHDYHQTLLFIGEVSDEEVPSIKERLLAISFPAFEIKTTTFQFFNRRIMYLGIEKSDELLALKKVINDLFPEWSSKETKSFHPHVTVKRWQRYEHADLVEGLSREAWTSMSFIANSVALFKSEKDAENHKYHVIDSIPLKSSN